MTQTSEQRFQLRDGMQPITFTGQLLATVSSQVDSHPLPRWTELAIYKTITGKYVLEKVGRSDVFHIGDLSQHPSNGKPGKGAVRYDSILDALADAEPTAKEQDVSSYFVPCEVCRPSYDPDEPVVVEQDMHSVDSFAEPEQLIEKLYFRKNGTRSLSNLSRTVLDAAAKRDAGIAAVLEASRKKPIDIS